MHAPPGTMSQPTDQQSGMPPARAVAILGNDAVLAARPATAVQLAHACLRAGFETTIPASWGDELVAAESVRQLAVRGEGGAILCSCAHVEAALLAPGDDLAPLLVPVVAPPVAAARYLRHVLADTPLRITYIGRCPSASADPSIDVQLSPAAFLRQLSERGIVLADQPTVFDSVLPPDRRRHLSLPGGTPAPSSLWEGERTRTLIEIESDEYKSELAQHLIAHRRAVIDLAPRLGCACSGAVGTTVQAGARAAVMTGEPPRAPHPVVEAPAELQLARRIVPRSPSPAAAPRATPPLETPPLEPPRQPMRETPRAERSDSLRKSTPSGPFRVYTGHVPTARSAEGRPLPRAYGAHRRTPSDNRAVGHDAPPPAAPEAPRPPEQKVTGPTAHEPREPREPRETSGAYRPSDAPVVDAARVQTHVQSHAEAPVATAAPAATYAPPATYAFPTAPASNVAERPIEIVRETVVERIETTESVTVEPAHAESQLLGGADVESTNVESADVERASVESANVEVADDAAAESPASEARSEVHETEVHETEVHEEESPVRRASATLITQASALETTSSMVALVRTRAIETYRQPTAFRLPHPRDPRSIAVVGVTLAVAAVLAVSAIRAARAPDDRDEPPASPVESSPLGTARADAATLPPAAGAVDAGRAPQATDARSAVTPPVPPPVTPPVTSPSRSTRGGRATPPTPAPTTGRRASSATSRTTSRADGVPAPAASAPPASAPTVVAPVTPEPTAVPTVAPAAPAAPQGLSPAERDSIQREIQARRARADSIQRRIDSMRTP